MVTETNKFIGDDLPGYDRLPWALLTYLARAVNDRSGR
jgi:hypothetical protein